MVATRKRLTPFIRQRNHPIREYVVTDGYLAGVARMHGPPGRYVEFIRCHLLNDGIVSATPIYLGGETAMAALREPESPLGWTVVAVIFMFLLAAIAMLSPSDLADRPMLASNAPETTGLGR